MPRLNEDDEMVKRMELDLITKTKEALSTVPHGSKIAVMGVFSLDHLEKMMESQLCNEIAVGVGYLGAVPSGRVGANLNVDHGNAAAMVDFRFVIVLAVSTDESCNTRYDATQLLTRMRKRILGKTVSGDTTNRTWNFISENPEISASTKQMLYYAQVWQVALPNIGGN